MAEHANATGATALAGSAALVPCARAGDAVGEKSGKQTEPLPWPLTWLNDTISEVSRVWSPFSQLELGYQARRAAKPALEKPSLAEDRLEKIDAPTSVDRLLHASMGRLISLSPYSLWLAHADWAIHLWGSPGKFALLSERGARNAIRYLTYVSNLASGNAPRPCIEPLPPTGASRTRAWRQPPFDTIYQSFLLSQQWWYNATTGVRGVDPAHERIVEFTTRQILDLFSPSNYPGPTPRLSRLRWRRAGRTSCAAA